MKKIIITNNDKVYFKYKDSYEVVLLKDKSYTDVLYAVRDRIHEGCKLLTHPMAGSLKPNQTPYKSVMLEYTGGRADAESVMLIENSIFAALKFLKFKSTPKWSDKILSDFQTVDLSLIENVVKNPMLNMA